MAGPLTFNDLVKPASAGPLTFDDLIKPQVDNKGGLFPAEGIPDAYPEQPKGPSLLRRGLDAIGETAQGAWDAVAGTGAEDVPELREYQPSEVQPPSLPFGLDEKLLGVKREKMEPIADAIMRMGFATNDQGKLDILRKTMGKDLQARYANDQSDRDALDRDIIVTMPDGKEYYLNKPGVSVQDVVDFLPGLVFGGGGALGGAKGLGGLGGVGKVVGSGLGGGGGSVVQDLTAQQMGSEEPVDWNRAAGVGLVGAGAEVAAPVVKKLVGMFRGRSDLYDEAASNLTPKGRKIAEEAGVNPDLLLEEAKKDFARLASSGADAGEAARLAQIKSAMPEVQPTKGQLTRDVNDFRIENEAFAGVRGDEAKTAINDVRNRQQDALTRGAEKLQEDLGTTPAGRATTAVTPETPGAGVDVAREKLTADYQAKRAETKRLYDAARADETTTVPVKPLQDMKRDFERDLIKSGGNLEKGPVKELLDEYKKVNLSGANVTGVKMNQLETWRQKLNRAIDESYKDNVATPTTKDLMDLKSRYDSAVNDVFDQNLAKGDPQALVVWRRARSARGEQGKYEANPVLEAMVRNSDDATDKNGLVSEQALNMLFGAQKAGFSRESVKAVATMKELLGPDSPEWGAVREEAFARLLGDQAKGVSAQEAAKRLTSGVKFDNSLGEALKNNPTFMKTLFSDQEIQKMREFAKVSRLLTESPKASQNPSGSGYAVQGLAREIFGPRATNVFNAAVKPLLGRYKDEADRALIRDAVTYLPTPPGVSPGVGGAVGAAGASSADVELPKGGQ